MASNYGRRIVRAQDEIARLTDRAGIGDAYEDVRYAEYGYRRMSLRRLFFGVSDVNVRKRLIGLTREIEELTMLLIEDERTTALKMLQAAERKAVMGSWGIAALIAGVSVAIGHLLIALSGAIGGAVVGYFLGRGYIEASKVKAASDVQWAKARLDEIERHSEGLPHKPELFSKSEAETGEEDKGFFSEILTQKQRASAG